MPQYITGFLIITILLGVFQWILSLWIKTRLEESIRHEYSKKLEEYKFEYIQKEKAEIIAKLFAKWIKYGGKTNEVLTKEQQSDYYEELNRMSFEATLWIQDEILVKEIMKPLAHDKDARGIKDLIMQAREMILGKKNANLKWEDIVHWQ